MKNSTVIAILAAAGLLFAFIFFFEKEKMTTSELTERKDRVFVEYRSDRVERLTVQRGKDKPVVMEKGKAASEIEEPNWSITAPVALEADSNEVREILSAIDYLVKGRTVKGEKERSDKRYGLVSPRVRASFTIRGDTTGFSIGGDAQDDKVYLAIDRIPGELYAVDKGFLASLDKGVDSLRSKKLVKGGIEEPSVLTLGQKAGPVRLARESGKPWRLEANGLKVQADRDKVEEILRAIADLSAERFIADGASAAALAKFGLEKPACSATLELAARKVALLVGGPCPGEGHLLYATVSGSGTVACVKDDLLPLLDRPAEKLMETRPAVFDDDAVTGVTISRDRVTLVLEKADEGWIQKGNKAQPLEQEAVSGLLKSLRETRASKIEVDAKKSGALGSPAAEVALAVADSPALKLAFFTQAGCDGVCARRDQEPAVLHLPAPLLDGIQSSPLAFRKRTISNAKASDLSKLRIDGPLTQQVEKVGDSWRVVAPVDLEADWSAARKVGELIAEIRVQRFVAPSASREHGLDKPFAVVTATFVDEKKTDDGKKDLTQAKEVALELGAETEGKGRFARLRGDPLVFVVGPDYAQAIEGPMVARDLLKIDETDLEKLALAAAGKERSFTRKDSEWSAEGGATVDKTRLQRLVADLGALKAVRAAGFGPAGSGFDKPTLIVRVWTRQALEKDAPAVITVGSRSDRAADDGYFARLGGLDVTFVVPARIVDDAVSFAGDIQPPKQD